MQVEHSDPNHAHASTPSPNWPHKAGQRTSTKEGYSPGPHTIAHRISVGRAMGCAVVALWVALCLGRAGATGALKRGCSNLELRHRGLKPAPMSQGTQEGARRGCSNRCPKSVITRCLCTISCYTYSKCNSHFLLAAMTTQQHHTITWRADTHTHINIHIVDGGHADSRQRLPQ